MSRIKSSALAVAGSGLMLLSACTDPNDGYQNARTGVGAGALAGAALGAVIGGDARGAAIGAVAGGMAGGAYGSYLDQQEAALRQSLGNDVKIVNTGDQLILTMPQDILFATDSATLRSDLMSDLRLVARSLNEYPNTRVQVVGHTDNTGNASYNQDLSQRRAASVVQSLSAYGVSPSRLRAIGRGENDPTASNLTSEGRALNRRVNIVIIPN